MPSGVFDRSYEWSEPSPFSLTCEGGDRRRRKIRLDAGSHWPRCRVGGSTVPREVSFPPARGISHVEFFRGTDSAIRAGDTW